MITFLRNAALVAACTASLASAVTRDEAITRAKGFAFHPWRASSANLRGTCASPYRSVYEPGDYLGLPYDWGGFISAFDFDEQISKGAAAGSYPADGVLSCNVGLDCSGFVSQCWGGGHYTTRSLPTVSTQLGGVTQLLAGDAMNEAGYHVAMFSHKVASGEPVFIESVGYNVHVNAYSGWSYVDGFLPIRSRNITGTTATDPVGTPTNPIVIASLPYRDTRDTKTSSSDFLDGCHAAPTKNETGPEFVYKLQITRPGQLTVTVQNDAGVDIDPHLFESLSTRDCTARHDKTFTVPVDCGTYYVVADTYSGAAKAGRYTIDVSLAASAGATCGAGPAAYHYSGAPGGRCAFPGNQNLPFCNDNLGAGTCIYTSGAGATSFCSHPCASNADCRDLTGGCCDEVGSGEKFCMVSSFCGGTTNPGTGTQGGLDAGFSDVDFDGGTAPVIDAGPGPVDAGTRVDAGTPIDAGSPVDAGPGPVDAGTRPDAGTVIVDAGAPVVDAGPVVIIDAGEEEPRVDAGSSSGGADANWDRPSTVPSKDDDRNDDPWGCSSAGGAGILAALALAARRRR